MGRLHVLVSATAIGCAVTLSTQASAFAPSELPRFDGMQDARIVCDEFDRCFRVGPYGRRVLLPPGAFYPGRGGYGRYGEGYDGPPEGDFGGPPERGFGPRPGARGGPPPDGGFGQPPGGGYGQGDDGRERGALRDGDDRDGGTARRPRRRDDSPGLRPDDGPGGSQDTGQFNGGRNRFGNGGDPGQRARRDGNDQFGDQGRSGYGDEGRNGNGDERRPRRQPGPDAQSAGPGGNPRFQQDDGGQ